MSFSLKFRERAGKLGGWFRRNLPEMRLPTFLGGKKKAKTSKHALEPPGSSTARDSHETGLQPSTSHTHTHSRQGSAVSIVIENALQTTIAVASPAELPHPTSQDTENAPPPPTFDPGPLQTDFETHEASSRADGEGDRRRGANGHVTTEPPSGRKKALLIGISGESPDEVEEPEHVENGDVQQNGVAAVEATDDSKGLKVGIARVRPDVLMALHRKADSQGSLGNMIGPLKGPHHEVEETRAILTTLYGYKDADIITLVDTEGQTEEFMPTRDNIVKHTQELVKNARPGDKFYFHYSGHSTQEAAKDPDEEEDGMNEVLWAWDRKGIVDNDLKKWLVDPLPQQTSLYAVFDTCNSGTILDLEHYRCNRVYLPWVNKGYRRTRSKHITAHRQHALPSRMSLAQPARGATLPQNQGSIDQIIRSTVPENGLLTQEAIQQRKQSIDMALNPQRQDGTPVVGTPRSSVESTRPPSLQSLAMFMSPVEMYCDGWCRSRFNWREEGLARVVCLSSCADGQRTWENANGSSMTSALMELLNNDSHPSFTQILHRVNNSLHKDYLHLHSRARAYKTKWRKKNEALKSRGESEQIPPVDPEMNNFQEVHLSSQEPLNLSENWDP